MEWGAGGGGGVATSFRGAGITLGILYLGGGAAGDWFNAWDTLKER